MKFLIFSFLFCFQTYAKVQSFIQVKSERLPLELVLLTESINELKLSVEDKDLITEHAKNLNRNLKFLNKDQIFFLMKSEIYKNVLEKEFHGDFKIMKFSNLDIEQIEKSYLLGKKEYSPFARWLVESVISDFSELKNYPGFNNVKLDVPEKDQTLNLVRKKLSLLSPWLGAIAGLKAQEFNGKMKRLMIKIMIDLDLSSSIYRSHTSAKELDPQDLITIQTLSNAKLPIKEKDEAPILEDKKAESLEDEAIEEGKKAEKLTSGLSAPEEITPTPNKIEKTSPRTWKPAEEKSKEGKTLPPPAKTWAPEN